MRKSDLVVTKQVNTKFCDQMKFLERQCWANEIYSRRECLEISGVPESVTDKDLEGKSLNLLEKKLILKYILTILRIATG